MGTMLKQRAELVDEIWHACGDTATDYNWYTKRGLLAGVYSATELFMITDYSPGYADTWKALDRRLEDVKRIGSATTEVCNLMALACAVFIIVPIAMENQRATTIMQRSCVPDQTCLHRVAQDAYHETQGFTNILSWCRRLASMLTAC